MNEAELSVINNNLDQQLVVKDGVKDADAKDQNQTTSPEKVVKKKKIRYNRNADNKYKQKVKENRKQIMKGGDLDVFPACFDLARRHREVLRFRELDEEEEQERRIAEKKKKEEEEDDDDDEEEKKDDEQAVDCVCCGRNKINAKIGFRTKNLNLSFLGPAYPLHFDFMEACIVMLLIIFIVCGLYNTITNSKSGSSCLDPEVLKNLLLAEGYTLEQAEKLAANQCQLNWISKYTLGNRRNQSDTLLTQELLNLLSIIVIIVYIQFFMKRQRTYSLMIDMNSVTPSDYTVFVTQIQKRLDLNLTGQNGKQYNSYRECILDYFESQMDLKKEDKTNFNLKGEIADISFCFNIDEYNQNEAKRIELLKSSLKRLEDEENERAKQNIVPKPGEAPPEMSREEKEEMDRLKAEINMFEIRCYEGYKGAQLPLGDEDKKQKEDLLKYSKASKLQYVYNLSKEAEAKIDEEIFKDANEAFMKHYFVGQAFLQFKTEKVSDDLILHMKSMEGLKHLSIATEFMDCVKKSRKPFVFQNKTLQFERAPDPTDINWSNLYCKKTMRMVRFGGGFLFNIGTVALASISIYYLAKLQYSYTKSNSMAPSSYDKAMIQLISFGISLIIIVINEVLVRIVDIFNQVKKFRMKTSQAISFTIFLSSAQFINSTVIPLLLLMMVSSADSYYSILYSPTGLILNQNSIFITNAIMPVVMYFIDPMYRWKQYKRYSEEKKQKCWFSQRELQQLFQDPEFQLSTQYASAIKTIYMTFFYLSVMPLCIFWSMLALIVQYATSKALLANRRIVLVSLSEQLSLSIIVLLKIALIIYACTSYLFLRLSNSLDNPYIPSLVGIAITVIHFCIPLQAFNEWLFKLDKLEVLEENKEENLNANNLTYEDARKKEFSTDYCQENPALKKKFIKYEQKITKKTVKQEDLFKQLKINQKQIKDNNKKQKDGDKKDEDKKDDKKQEDNKEGPEKSGSDIKKTDNTIENKMKERQNSQLSQTLFTNSSLIPQFGFGMESLETLKQKLFMQSFNTISKANSIDNNKQTLKEFLEFSDRLNKKYKTYESKIQNNTLTKADLSEIKQIDELIQIVNEKTKGTRKILAEQMKEERKSLYKEIEKPQQMQKEISSMCAQDKFEQPQEKQQEYKKFFGITDWITSYFRNYDTKLLDNKDYLGDTKEIADIEELNESLIKKRIRLRDYLEKSVQQ